jgi:hypothetical protein
MFALTFQAMALSLKNSRTALRESNEHIRNILENVSDGFAAFDRKWRCTYVNDKTTELSRTLERRSRRSPSFLRRDDGSVKFPLENARSSGCSAEWPMKVLITVRILIGETGEFFVRMKRTIGQSGMLEAEERGLERAA